MERLRKIHLLDNSIELNNKDSNDAFSIDLLKEYKTIKDEKTRNYPLFICDVEGKTYYVAPVMGKGLWAAVWGFIALMKQEIQFQVLFLIISLRHLV